MIFFVYGKKACEALFEHMQKKHQTYLVQDKQAFSRTCGKGPLSTSAALSTAVLNAYLKDKWWRREIGGERENQLLCNRPGKPVPNIIAPNKVVQL